jgi:aminodeoxyfutalosine deaminase
MPPTRQTLAARYVFPVESPPIADGIVTVERGRIAAVGPRDGQAVDLDLGNVAIVPGFVNAHTHLELAALGRETALPNRPENEVAWLKRVISQRRERGADALRRAVAANLDESLAAGTTLLADTTTAGMSWNQIAAAPLRAVVFAELIGLRRERGLQTSDEAWSWIATVGRASQVAACARPGLSPHAPYSTAGWLYQRAAASRLPLSTHIAEMPEEQELLATRTGPLREFLEDLGAWDDDWEPVGTRPADYVRKGELRQADWILAHGNYLDPEEFWQLRPEAAPEGHRVAVAYCPRTHARFGHAPHPFRAMLERGVVVCLGTDSRASSPTLSVLDEARFLFRRDPSLNGPLLLTMATLFGAWALRAENSTGSLRAGKSADLALVSLPDREAADPHDLVFDSDEPVVGTVFEGRFVAGRWVVD